MRRNELKQYTNHYHGLPRLFVGRGFGFIYLRGGLGYGFWKHWSKYIHPANLLEHKIFIGRNVPKGFSSNCYARRLWQRHVSDCYYYNQLDKFGIVFHPREYWSFVEHKEHCRKYIAKWK